MAIRRVLALLLSVLPALGAQAAEYCAEPHLAIPDIGVIETTMDVEVCDRIDDLDVALEVPHTWVGDLTFTVTLVDSGISAKIYDRPGVPQDGPYGCSADNIDAILDDEASLSVECECAETEPAIFGSFVGGDPPDDTLLAAFDAQDACGTWRLTIQDDGGGDIGTLDRWCLIVSTTTDPVPATGAVSFWVLVVLVLVLSLTRGLGPRRITRR